ncbi:MAG: membrane protein insertion efficiency factor YidD [Verrucomicrobiota bacterium]|nr:membrane protein insertion efficiency factor YidD [Verrucomicrobiota bacterium]
MQRLCSISTICFLCLCWSTPSNARPGFFEPWGKDTALLPQHTEEPLPEKSLATLIAQGVIAFHQNVISPVDGPRSHYRPSSSQYMKLAMDHYGFLRGFIMGCDRLLRENNEEWVYRKIEIDGQIFKYDPPIANKYSK